MAISNKKISTGCDCEESERDKRTFGTKNILNMCRLEEIVLAEEVKRSMVDYRLVLGDRLILV
jgi:hypothetical protein